MKFPRDLDKTDKISNIYVAFMNTNVTRRPQITSTFGKVYHFHPVSFFLQKYRVDNKKNPLLTASSFLRKATEIGNPLVNYAARVAYLAGLQASCL
jgi:hypothetical protein